MRFSSDIDLGERTSLCAADVNFLGEVVHIAYTGF